MVSATMPKTGGIEAYHTMQRTPTCLTRLRSSSRFLHTARLPLIGPSRRTAAGKFVYEKLERSKLDLFSPDRMTRKGFQVLNVENF